MKVQIQTGVAGCLNCGRPFAEGDWSRRKQGVMRATCPRCHTFLQEITARIEDSDIEEFRHESE